MASVPVPVPTSRSLGSPVRVIEASIAGATRSSTRSAVRPDHRAPVAGVALGDLVVACPWLVPFVVGHPGIVDDAGLPSA